MFHPYKEYNVELNEMTYIYNDNIEYLIYEQIDRQLNKLPCYHIYDFLYDFYNKDSIECRNTINKIVSNCIMIDEHEHAEKLLMFYNQIIRNEKYIASQF